MIGTTISHYRVVEKLGEGGMGIVYKAYDTSLDRFVAFKILPAEKAGEKERRRRFLQEAKAASALEHPNIVTIYEILEQDDRSYIVMQYVPGKTLRDLLSSGPLSMNVGLRIAVQIADALACAHSRGIVHRDLKPENVMVTPEGQVKVLDFGLAKILPAANSEATVTLTSEQTEAGQIVGTIAYMSPEQAQARPVDTRSDVFSFGCVLYEIVTGRLAFQGANRLSTLAAILRDEPVRISEIAPAVPLDLERLVARALRKNPERRWQSMADVRVILAEMEEESASGTAALLTESTEASRRPMRKSRVVALAFILVVVGVTVWMRLRNPTPSKAPVIVPFTSYAGREMTPSLSPDGNQVAFSWGGKEGDNFDIYVKLIGTGTPLRLTTDPAEDSYPTWSPDGRFIAFIREPGKAVIVPALGGPERKICDAVPAGLGWSPNGKFLAVVSGRFPSAISLVSVDTGQERKVTSPPGGSLGDSLPAFSPDGTMLAFRRRPRAIRTGDLQLLRLNSEGTPNGEPIRLTFDDREISAFGWSPEGDSLVFSSARAGGFTLWNIRVGGRGSGPEQLRFAAENVQSLSISRQRSRMVYVRAVEDHNIWRAPGPNATSMGNAAPQKLIASTQSDVEPQYSPDGTKIAFSSRRSGYSEIWISESDGSNQRQVTSFAALDVGTPRWSPDGKRLAFDSMKDENRNIFVVTADGGGLRRLTSETSAEVRPSWSGDGQWIYFGSDRTGTFQVWKTPAEGGMAVQVTRNGGGEAFESSDGNVYYVRGQTSQFLDRMGIWRVPVSGGEEVQVLDAGWQGHWGMFKNGFVLLNPAKPAIEYFLFGSKSPIPLIDLPRIAIPSSGFGFSALAVSADGKWLLYVQLDSFESDIMLVDDFR